MSLNGSFPVLVRTRTVGQQRTLHGPSLIVDNQRSSTSEGTNAVMSKNKLAFGKAIPVLASLDISRTLQFFNEVLVS
ncbi:hypothetical protein [Paraburkholderia sp. BL25I1N1]|uniref:hypothetical protein n=1 Tax=Paraburkholderia sp. BL25I1N1 TaxID=1938804 RepID=UPI000D427656|nr:hypothetical protein [Paraburkholderia sp. BL25I1N1]PRY04583.1 hypothetical protein B0G73_112261 [Paraburkholderia sp. BL25I1N1]